MSVMGQAQALIGMMIVLSSAAAYFLSPWAGVVPAVLGAALLISGITGRCPMAGLICHMPWNRGRGNNCGLASK
ncbi:MAG: DUF2892 domain-containing protein [Tepidisphaeraceae bacterium]